MYSTCRSWAVLTPLTSFFPLTTRRRVRGGESGLSSTVSVHNFLAQNPQDATALCEVSGEFVMLRNRTHRMIQACLLARFLIKVRRVTSLGKAVSALAASSRSTVRIFPPTTAAWRAVEPFWRQDKEGTCSIIFHLVVNCRKLEDYPSARAIRFLTLRRPSIGENFSSSSTTPLCPFSAALNNAVDPSLRVERPNIQISFSCFQLQKN